MGDTAPIFIIGNPRSGTTLLRLMLTCHPRIVVPPEAGFLIQLYTEHRAFAGRAEQIDRYLQALLVSPKFEYWKLSEPVLRDAIAAAQPRNYTELSAAVYACYATVHDPAKSRWGDKNNFYLDHIDTIAAIFPRACFLHIVRDGRDVACSYRSLAGVRGEYAPRLPTGVFDAVYEWSRNLVHIRAAFARVGWSRVHELRYEDLAREPEAVLRRVCSFLGEEFAPSMLDYDRANRERELEPRDFDAWKRRNREGIDVSAIGRWRTELTGAEAHMAGVAGARMLERYGYDAAARSGLAAHVRGVGMSIRYHLRRGLRRFR